MLTQALNIISFKIVLVNLQPMKFQNRAILSLGSNQGDRLQHIQDCISYIHNHIATVVQVSGLYETPSWGFESDDFYNCAVLVHTHKTAVQLLQELLKAELDAGRVRGEGQGYSARVIDVDIIAFNNEVAALPELTLPHPRMQDRNFVLYPLRDVMPEWVHPVLKKDIDLLIEESADHSDCKLVSQLENPIKSIQFTGANYIAIEGNIGAGKTSLSGRIAEDFNAKIILERFADNPFLPKFYKEPSRYAFPLEMSFLADRHQQLSDDLSQLDLFSDFVVSDYHIFKSLIFAKVTLTEDEYRLYHKLFDIINRETPKPDLYVYLYRKTDALLEQIKKRGRTYEQDIQPEYLDKLNSGYMEYIKTQQGMNILLIDVEGKDFVNNQEDYLDILNQIQNHILSN